jgi:hypothetical protein
MQEGLDLIKDYDIVFMSYCAGSHDVQPAAAGPRKYGVQHVLDVDDDMFAIHPGNPYWLKHNHDQVYIMQRMIAHADHLTTHLRRAPQTAAFPSGAKTCPRTQSPSYRTTSATIIKTPALTNGEYLVIGYMGGSSHYFDLDETGVIEAIERIMHEHKNVHFQSIGMFRRPLPADRTAQALRPRRARRRLRDQAVPYPQL